MSSAHFTKPLLNWYAANARDLPWRRTSEPYAIWLSEVMLQQTQVKTVLPRYRTWLDQFPDIETLANADIDQVLKAWEGLGYYRRARLLHASAQTVATEFNGSFPTEFNDILALSGIGRSTAGAISSFCFGTSTPVLDGNVKRALKRWHGNNDLSDKQLWQLAQQHIDHADDPAAWNQAMMELGATCCTPRNPGCTDCPVQSPCASAFQVSDTKPASKRIPVKDVHWQVHLHTDPERGIWLQQRPDSGIWAGLWSPPITELAEAPDLSPCHVHLLTHRRLHLYGSCNESLPTGDGCWISDTNSVALPTGIRCLLEKQQLT